MKDLTMYTTNTQQVYLVRPETILSSGLGEARLVLEWARKDDTGLYLCHASNTIDSPPPISTAIVVTRE